MSSDNSADRMLSVLKKGKEEDPNANCKAVWYKILDIKDGDMSALMARLGKFMELSEITIREVEKHFPNRVDTCMHWNSQIGKALSNQNLNSNWSSFIGHIDIHTITYLGLTSELLASKSSITLIKEDKLVEIRKKIDSVYKEVIKSDLEEDVKSFLLRSIQKILVCIDEYQLTGAIPVIDAIEVVFGHAVIDKNFRDYVKENPICKKVIDTLSVVASLVTLALGMPEIAENVKLLLGFKEN